jgi:hypothetical protein
VKNTKGGSYVYAKAFWDENNRRREGNEEKTCQNDQKNKNNLSVKGEV